MIGQEINLYQIDSKSKELDNVRKELLNLQVESNYRNEEHVKYLSIKNEKKNPH